MYKIDISNQLIVKPSDTIREVIKKLTITNYRFQLVVKNKKLLGTIVDGDRKALLLREIADGENVCLEQVIAVGDGANDLPMLSIAGLGIAYRAKPLVKANAKQSISKVGLDGILYLMGISDRDVSRLE